MNKKRHMTGLPFLIGVVLLVIVFSICTVKERKEGEKIISDTLDFMRLQCIRYNNQAASEETKDQILLLDKTRELERCLEEKDSTEIQDFISEYAENQRLSGVILLDENMEPTDAAYMDEKQYVDWKEITQDKHVVDVMQYPQKNYISYIQLEDGSTYNYAAVARKTQPGYIFCYVRQLLDETDEKLTDIENLLAGYQLEMDGLMIISDGEQILSSNKAEYQGKTKEDVPLIANYCGKSASSEITTLRQNGATYLACSGKVGTYHLHVFFPTKEIYQHRTVIMAYALVCDILFLLIFAFARQREAQRSDQLKMKFLRQMSHDLRTPINGIRGMIRIADSFPEDIQKQKECRQKIWEASDFLMDLVNDVLDMGKLESGEVILEEKPFNLKELVQNVVTVMENPAKEHGVTLQIDRMEGEHWNLIGSPAPLRRILNNLINNATKYNRKNGTISISCREIDISSQEGQTVYEITCADTGIGMSRDFQKHMFEQFMQENATEGLAHHGTGLGLSIVKNLVERMSGSIRCESERGKGTTFYIKIPFEINTDVVETPVIAEDVPEEALQGVSVLLVEDNELNMEIAEFILGEMGMKITKAWNGQEAVQIFEQSKLGEIQIILMDMMMPVMNGEQAARAIRELDRADARTVPIIATTANAFEEDVKAALGAGMNDHLAKPLDEKALKKVMAHYVTTNVKYGT